jgi:hypothetical protein
LESLLKKAKTTSRELKDVKEANSVLEKNLDIVSTKLKDSEEANSVLEKNLDIVSTKLKDVKASYAESEVSSYDPCERPLCQATFTVGDCELQPPWYTDGSLDVYKAIIIAIGPI